MSDDTTSTQINKEEAEDDKLDIYSYPDPTPDEQRDTLEKGILTLALKKIDKLIAEIKGIRGKNL